MQLTTIPAGAVPLHPPIGSRPGMPTRESVIAGYTPSGRFPGTGLGLGGWLLPTAGYDEALAAASRLSVREDRVMGVLRHGLDSYAVAPLVQLTWHAGGYGGHFRESIAAPGGRDVYALRGKSSELVAVLERGRKLVVRPA